MQRAAGLVLIAVGGALLFMGWQGSRSWVDRAKNAVTGSYTERTNLHLALGVGSIVAGLLTAASGGPKKS